MTKPSEQFHKKVIEFLKGNISILKIPVKNQSGDFKKVLKNRLDDYLDYFNKNIEPLTRNLGITFNQIHISEISTKIEVLNDGLLKSIDKYLEGKPFEANKIFNTTLSEISYTKVKFERTLPENKLFYRARVKSNKHYSKEDLFHIPFQKRTLVSTNRYSIPGIPALYLGENSYTCWEEFDRDNFKDLYFSVYESTEKMNIIEILRIEDFLNDIEKVTPDYPFKTMLILQFLVYFPISIACTLKVYNRKGNFKPEYIIPQMLLEYIIQDEEIDGIKFPSTKINYDNLKNIQAYNYVFPIKKNEDSGFCAILKEKFQLSSPSSLELEELLNNPYTTETQSGGGINFNHNSAKISINDGDERYYENTSFGKLEFILKNKIRKKL